LVAIGVASYVASEWGPRNHPSATFYLAHSRAWERLTESVAAFVLTRKDTAATKALLFGRPCAGQCEPFWNKVGAETGLNIHAVSINWCFPALNDDFTGPKTSRAVDQCKLNRDWVRQNAGSYDVIILGGRWSDINGQGLDQDVIDYVAFRQSSTDARIIIMASPPALNRVTVEEFVATGKGVIDADYALNAAIQTVQSNFVKLAASRKRVFYFFRRYPVWPGWRKPVAVHGRWVSLFPRRNARQHLRRGGLGGFLSGPWRIGPDCKDRATSHQMRG
jgi:SGNH domain (fused to AT3 domains)